MSTKYLISGIMANIELYCGNHHEPVRMSLIQGPFSAFYACPKYNDEERKPGEHKCANRLSVTNLERMVDHINSMLCDNGSLNNSVNIKGHVWRDNGVDYKILVHNRDKICVQCLDHSALTNIKR